MIQLMEALKADDNKTCIEIMSEINDKQLSKVKDISDKGVTKVVFFIGVWVARINVQNLLSKVTDY